MEIINVKNLCKNYKNVKAVNNVSFQVNKGEIFGLLGVNGAGKTTIIKILTGLIKKDNGEITIDNFDIEKNIYEIKKIINVSPQNSSFASKLSVKENLNFFAKIYDVQDQEYINHLIEIFALNDVLNQKANKLSGGYQRRLSIAISLINKPKILFLDEPTLGLDVLARHTLWEIIKQIKTNTTIVLTSHYLEEIEALCDHVMIMSKGENLAYGNVEELIKESNSKNLEDAFIKIVNAKKRN